MTEFVEAPVVLEDERIRAPRPTDAARMAEILFVLARKGLLTVFATISPNLRKIGRLSPRRTDGLVGLGVMAPNDL